MQEVLERSIQDVLQMHPFKLEVEQAWTKSSTYLYRSIAAIQQLWQVRQVIMCCQLPSLSKLPSTCCSQACIGVMNKVAAAPQSDGRER